MHGGDPQARKVHTTANVQEAEPSSRQLSSERGLVYSPLQALFCERCSECKREGAKMRKCRKICLFCPGAVMVGAGKVLSIAVDGITTTQYVRRAATEQGQGRSLLGGDYGNGVDVIQSGTTIFEGR